MCAFFQNNKINIISLKLAGLALLLSGCVTGGSERPNIPDNSSSNSASTHTVPITQLDERYRSQPNDKKNTLAYTKALAENGDTDQSLAVVRKLVIAYPKDREVLGSYGAALAAAGQYKMALETISRAQTPEQPDWRLLSTEASIWDRLGQFNKARPLYQKALNLNPEDPSIMSNIGMSYILSGDLKLAENSLRKAAAKKDATAHIRQNLALAIGLQGRHDEAKKLYMLDMSMKQADENIAYIKSLKKR